jgi:hypothetical protein
MAEAGQGVQLRGVRISGPLNLEAAAVRCPLLAAQGIKVGTVFLDQGFTAAGAVSERPLMPRVALSFGARVR